MEMFETAKSTYRRIEGLGEMSQLAQWYQETYMPENAAEELGARLSEVAVISHRLTKELAENLVKLPRQLDTPEQTRERLLWQRLVDQNVTIPEELVKKHALQVSLTLETWKKARAAKDYQVLRGDLEKLIGLTQESTEYFRGNKTAYDALMDIYEPGLNWAMWEKLESELLEFLVPHVKIWKETRKPRASTTLGMPIDVQKKFCHEVLQDLGFDWKQGRLDVSTHPFCSGTGSGVRLTTRFSESDCLDGLYSALHECGHGLYEQNLPMKHRFGVLGSAVGLGVHESQSRFWENIIGRSLEFCHYLKGKLEKFGVGSDLTPQTLHEMLNSVQPSYVRVESDEGTYNLHIIIRGRLEQALFAGKMKVADLRDAWNDHYAKYLGITPRNDLEGVLQDVHWPNGLFGYFTTYSVGNLISGQILNKIKEEIPGSLNAVKDGQFSQILEWLKTRVHARGNLVDMPTLVREVTGQELGTKAYMGYLKSKLGAL